MHSILDESVEKHGPIDLLLVAADQPRQSLPYIVDSACFSRSVP
jgi:hypothetical protein